MLYDNLIHNKKIIDIFTSYVNNQNLPHAIIFYGSEGRGKFSHALELCNMLLSQNQNLNLIEKKIKKNEHENIHFIFPLPKSKSISKNDSALKALSSSDLEYVNIEIKNKLNNPYYNLSIKKANTILVNSIRDIKKNISLSNINNNWNIYIILEAEKLCYPRAESANALLKVLEEPNEKNLFILVTSNISQILETITSRCSKLYFPKLKSNDIKNFIIDEYNLDLKQSSIVSNLSNGNMTFASKIAKDYDSYIEKISIMIDLLFNFNLNKWQTLFSKLKNNNEITFLLNLLIIYFNDIALYKGTQLKEKLKFSFLSNQIIESSNKYQLKKINDVINIINETKQNITKNIYSSLLITSFYLEIHQKLSNHTINKMNYNNKHNLYSING